jgi:hypothetical protein
MPIIELELDRLTPRVEVVLWALLLGRRVAAWT